MRDSPQRLPHDIKSKQNKNQAIPKKAPKRPQTNKDMLIQVYLFPTSQCSSITKIPQNNFGTPEMQLWYMQGMTQQCRKSEA